MTDKPIFAAPTASNVEDLRAWLCAISNRELRDFGASVQWKLSQSEPGDPQGVALAIQLEEAHAEWRRRHPQKAKSRTDAKKEHTDAKNQ